MRNKSEEIYKRLQEVIVGGVNSPVRMFRNLDMTPLVAESAFGSTLCDADGTSYIDYCMSWGSLIHGHANPQIMQAVIERIQKGSSFGVTTEIEEKLGSKIIQHMPSIEQLRFVSSGTEATMSAVRVARGFTKKSYIIKFIGGYHGHADAFLVEAGSGLCGLNQTSSSAGVPKEHVQWTLSLPYNDKEAFDRVLEDKKIATNLAACIIEPIATNMGLVPATEDFLLHIRKRTEELQALLIFDEVVTGFRVGLGGAQKAYGIQPDMTCLGKIIGGGFPAAAFGGRKEIMHVLAPFGQVYQAGTLSGNPVAMEAGYQALLLLEKPHFYEELQVKTDFLLHPFRSLFTIQQVGSCFTFFFGPSKVRCQEEAMQSDREQFKDFFTFLFERGIYIPPSPHEICTLSTAHSYEELKQTQEAIMEYQETCAMV